MDKVEQERQKERERIARNFRDQANCCECHYVMTGNVNSFVAAGSYRAMADLILRKPDYLTVGHPSYIG